MTVRRKPVSQRSVPSPMRLAVPQRLIGEPGCFPGLVPQDCHGGFDVVVDIVDAIEMSVDHLHRRHLPSGDQRGLPITTVS